LIAFFISERGEFSIYTKFTFSLARSRPMIDKFSSSVRSIDIARGVRNFHLAALESLFPGELKHHFKSDETEREKIFLNEKSF
jgi:hypothetical protein